MSNKKKTKKDCVAVRKISNHGLIHQNRRNCLLMCRLSIFSFFQFTQRKDCTQATNETAIAIERICIMRLSWDNLCCSCRTIHFREEGQRKTHGTALKITLVRNKTFYTLKRTAEQREWIFTASNVHIEDCTN